jgi:hypothetical protein
MDHILGNDFYTYNVWEGEACTVSKNVAQPPGQVWTQLGVAVTTGVMGQSVLCGGRISVCNTAQAGRMQGLVTSGQTVASSLLVYV